MLVRGSRVRTERGERMCFRQCLSRIRLPARLRRHPARIPVPLVPDGRGLVGEGAGDKDIGTLEEAIRAGRATEWLIARTLREKSEAVLRGTGAGRRRPK